MEIVVRDGRIARNACGLPAVCGGNDAALQRAENRIRAKRGAFPYDRTFGSRLSAAGEEEHPAAFSLAAAREALFAEPTVSVLSAEAEGGAVTVRVAAGEGVREIRMGGAS